VLRRVSPGRKEGLEQTPAAPTDQECGGWLPGAEFKGVGGCHALCCCAWRPLHPACWCRRVQAAGKLSGLHRPCGKRHPGPGGSDHAQLAAKESQPRQRSQRTTL